MKLERLLDHQTWADTNGHADALHTLMNASEALKGVEQEVEQQEQGASSSTDALEVMATPEPVSVEGSGAASSSSSASVSNQKRIAELSDEE